MQNSQNSYKQAFKATSLFGGVQFFNILISIVRSKIVALLLGPVGMGIFGLFSSGINLITGLTGMGLGASAVRNVAAAKETGNNIQIAKVVSILGKLVWLTGLMGAFACIIFSPWLSKITFGNYDYTNAFYWLSISLLLNQLTIGENVLMQGMRQLKFLAAANVLGAFLSLLISLPLYFFYKINGIVPAMIATSICSLLVSIYFKRKIPLKKIKVTTRESMQEGKSMLKVGFFLSLSSFVALGESYIVRIYISNNGSLGDVGLYNAGFAIIGTYVGMIFTAMATDYYPRLASAAHDTKRANPLINQQAEIAILILAPILCIFLIFVDWGVIILYSEKFLPVTGMIHWAAIGMFFKAASWAVGYIFLARGDGKVFFWSEILATSYLLLFNILGYKYWGLSGLGMSFLCAYIVCFFQVVYIAKWRYQFRLEKYFTKIFVTQLIIGILVFLTSSYLTVLWSYIIGIILIAVSLTFSFRAINKHMNLKNKLTTFLNRKN